MRKQRKQLLIMLIALIFAIAALVLVLRLPDDEEIEDGQDYQVTDLDKENINKLSFSNAGGMYCFTKQDEVWIYEDDKELEIDADAIESMIGKVAALTSPNCIEQAEDIAQYGLDEPAATILISDGTKGYTLLVGDYNELTGTYYLCLESDEQTVYTTDSSAVSDFIEKGIDDLRVAEESETTTES